MNTGVFTPGLAEQLYEQLLPMASGMSVEVVPSCDSTNTRLLDRARAGDTSTTLLVTETQTAGRGRMGRAWQGESGDCLMFSLGLRLAPQSWSGLSLVVGWALARALHPDIRLKWPNDLWLHECKLAGILIETANIVGGDAAQRYVVMGCGINIAPVPQSTSSQLRTPAACLQSVQANATASSALLAVAAPLLQAVLAFEHLGFAPWRERYQQLDALAQRSVQVMEGERVACVGMAQGVSESGGLLVHTWDGMQEITSGEVSVRPD